ncbi:BTAD domain-containing putative transcriptional regulator [Nonomuraea angiospora]|uniref:AfsR/SARP family transcriptional regulator n=1 Tax=Nonomuraea angiospora TaxID=46172 RepID=UPI0034076164
MTAQADTWAHLRLLGRFLLQDRMGAVRTPVGARRLLALLAIQGPVERDTAACMLWPDVTERHAYGSLRTTLWRLRKVTTPVVIADGAVLELAPLVVVDARMLAERAQRAIRLQEDVALPDVMGDGELLPGWDEDWVIFERERLRQLRLHALEALVTTLLARDQRGEALDAALLCLRLEPLRESAHRAIVAVHLAERNVAEALRAYESFRRLLREEMGLEPSAEFQALVAPLRGR